MIIDIMLSFPVLLYTIQVRSIIAKNDVIKYATVVTLSFFIFITPLFVILWNKKYDVILFLV